MNERAKGLLKYPKSFSVSFGLVLFATVIGLLVIGCQSADPDPTGGETHFLRACDPNDNSCGSELSCICGACSIPCETDAACSDFGDARCLAGTTTVCGASSPSQACEVTCTADADCGAISDEHVCENGACRRPVETEVDSTSSGEVDSAGGAPMATCQVGATAANEVLFIGDSFFASAHQITAFLEELARSAGVIEVGERYRDQSRLVENALALEGEGISDQYQSAVIETPARVVIMNGGGADVLLGACETLEPNCPLIEEASEAFGRILDAMEQDGVDQVIFVGYPDPAPVGVLERMDLLRPQLQERCAASSVPCHFLDLRPVFEGHYEEYVYGGGLNPTSAGSEATAAAIWQLMQNECIAQ